MLYHFQNFLIAICTKRGYYVRRVKQVLWSSFGICRLQPFSDNWKKDQMQKWKNDPKTQKAYDELYTPVDANDNNSDMYITKIIKATFTSNDRTLLNSLWTQAVLEVIFNPDHLLPK